MLDKLNAIIAREEAFLPKFAPGTAQHSLLKNRIAALETVCDLIAGACQPSRMELEFALPRIESIIHKMSTARGKYEPDSRNYQRFTPTIQLMSAAKALILQALEGQR